MSRYVLMLVCVIPSMAASTAPASPESFLPYYENGAIEFAEDLTIGGDTEDEDYILFLPIDMAVGPTEHIYVLDYKMCWIKKFTPEGGLLTTFSRQGEGPGEIARARCLTVGPDGNVVIFDSGNHRFTVFDEDGNYIDSRNFQAYVDGLDPGPEGEVFALTSWFTDEWLTKGLLYQVVRFSADLADVTVIDSAYVRDNVAVQMTDNSMTTVGAPFVPRMVCAALPTGGIVVGHGGEYALKVFSPDLELVDVIRRDVDRLEITDADKDAYYAEFDDQSDNFQILVRKKVFFPRHKPYFQRILVDHEGYVLVETYVEASLEKNSAYDVFATNGEYVNRVEMPRLRPATVFANGCVYTTIGGDETFPAVIRYRPKPLSGSDGP